MSDGAVAVASPMIKESLPDHVSRFLRYVFLTLRETLFVRHRRPLFSPCKCSGSMGKTHQDCLTSWLEVTRGSGE